MYCSGHMDEKLKPSSFCKKQFTRMLIPTSESQLSRFWTNSKRAHQPSANAKTRPHTEQNGLRTLGIL